MVTFIDCKNLEELRKMLDKLVALYDLAQELQAQLPKKIIEEYFVGNIVALEKQLLTSMEIINGLDEDRLKRMDKNMDIAYPTGISHELLMLDVALLLNYLNEGNKISKYWFLKPFLPRAIKKALYIISNISVNGDSCMTKKNLIRIEQDLRLWERFRKLSRIWDSEPPLGSSHHNKHGFFKNTILKAIDLITVVDEAENLRLEIQKTSNLFLKPFEKKCRAPIGGKKIGISNEMDDFMEYSFQEIYDYTGNVFNMEKE